MCKTSYKTLLFSAFLLIIHIKLCLNLKIINLHETNRDATSIKLEWNTQNDDHLGDETWIGYKIKYSFENDSLKALQILIENLQDTSYRLENLKPFTEYKIQVSAYNKLDDEGPASNLLIVKTHESVPGAPQDLKALKTNTTSIEIEWRPPKRDEQNGIIKAYQIQYTKLTSLNEENDVKNVKLKANQELKYVLSDLEPQTSYKIQVFAINSKGDGQRSTSIYVSTKEAFSTRPENIYTQLSDDELRLFWSEPTKLSDAHKIDGYRVVFNNEQFMLNASTREISFKQPKWQFNNKYDLRVAVKLNRNGSYGDEAVSTISTNMNYKKLNLTASLVSSTSALLKWNNVDNQQQEFKIEYFSRSKPKDIIRLNNLNRTQLLLNNLEPKQIYFVQLASTDLLASIVFETKDVDSPLNLMVTRSTQDKVHVKWDPLLESYQKDYSIKGYRVYYAEYGRLDYDWKQLDVNDAQNTNIIINLNDKKSYVFQVSALDRFNNEGKKSDMVVLYETSNNNNKEIQHTEILKSETQAQHQQQMINYVRNDDIGIPRDLIIIEYSSTSVKFGWYPPNFQGFSGSQTKRHSFLIQYVDRPKTYRDSNGQFTTDSKGTTFKIYVPGRDDLSMRVMWMLNGLMPDCIYDFNITTLIDQTHGPPVSISLRTKRDRPAYVDKPLVKGIYEDNTVLLRLGNASEKNGQVSRYWLIVVPNNEWNRLQETRESELTSLLKYSFDKVALSGRSQLLLSNETAYITAEFEAAYWPNEFLLGNEKSYGRFVNRRLIRGIGYKVYSIAFTDDSNPSSYQQTSANKIDLADVFSINEPSLFISSNGIGELFTASQYSDVFNTRPLESKPLNPLNDYQNLMWIGGAISAVIFIIILLASVSLHLMRKKRRNTKESQITNSAVHQAANTNTITTATTSSSASPTTLLINTNNHAQNNTLKSLDSLNKQAPLGLLTTVQPMFSSNSGHTNNMTPSHYLNHSDNLYTSIDITQRQFLLSTPHHEPAPPLAPLFQQTTTFQTSTLSTASSNFDPIELRRLQYGTLGMQTHPPISVDELATYVDKLRANNNEKFAHEYMSIEQQKFTFETSTLDHNRAKNRYANVIAFDHSRVVLSGESDYINANYIDGYRKRNAYVATQGPLPSSYGDFWRMIWEQRTSIIVMMTKLEELSRIKCDQYWPSKGVDLYDCMQIALVDLTELSTYSIRTFIIANLKYPNEPKREIKHFQYTAWPDHGVPDHATPFLMFCRRVRFTNPPDSGPIVVHCSAGVGRTGCYIVIDTQLERLKHEQSIDIYANVTCLRAQRNFMVQTELQYIFCYEAVLEAVQNGNTEVLARNLYNHLECLLQTIDENCSLTEMELEYKRLTNVKAPQSKFLSANLPSNKFKNRLVNILPYESTRVELSCLPSTTQPNLIVEGSDYINANYIDGYKYRKAYIATQAPLNETIEDFWRMMWEVNSSIIVMLTKLREMGREKCAQYWPMDRSVRYQYFVIDPIAEYDMSQYVLREFKITDARDGQSRTIRQFQFNDWPEQGVPKSGENIIELIGQVHKTKEQFGLIGPITVHCSAGVGRTGVFITLSIVLERMRFEGIIDVFNTVKMLRAQRPAMVQTEDQYQFCYRAALEYMGSFDNYDS